MELHEQLDQVKDANTFLAFAHALAEDKSNGVGVVQFRCSGK